MYLHITTYEKYFLENNRRKVENFKIYQGNHILKSVKPFSSALFP